ncbi:hypothetical protein D1872_222030 [compost metagenome]
MGDFILKKEYLEHVLEVFGEILGRYSFVDTKKDPFFEQKQAQFHHTNYAGTKTVYNAFTSQRFSNRFRG